MGVDINYWSGNVTVFTSLDGEFAVVENLEQILKVTQNRLLMSSPWIGKGVVDLMRRTLRNGVEIKVLTRQPRDNNDNTANAINSLCSLAAPHAWKVEVNCTSKFHPKFIVVDTTCCLAGSLNPTGAGMYYNYELGFVIENPDIVSKVSDFFFNMWERSVTWEQVRQFNGYEREGDDSNKRLIADRYVGVLLSNGSAPLPKWKVTKELESRYRHTESEIVEVEKQLTREGIVYEPRTDWVCLTPTSE